MKAPRLFLAIDHLHSQSGIVVAEDSNRAWIGAVLRFGVHRMSVEVHDLGEAGPRVRPGTWIGQLTRIPWGLVHELRGEAATAAGQSPGGGD